MVKLSVAEVNVSRRNSFKIVTDGHIITKRSDSSFLNLFFMLAFLIYCKSHCISIYLS